MTNSFWPHFRSHYGILELFSRKSKTRRRCLEVCGRQTFASIKMRVRKIGYSLFLSSGNNIIFLFLEKNKYFFNFIQFKNGLSGDTNEFPYFYITIVQLGKFLTVRKKHVMANLHKICSSKVAFAVVEFIFKYFFNLN